MLQLEKDLLEIQLQVSKWQPVVRKIMNPLYGYVHCSYLVSNATTYLNTNYIPNTETKLDIKFKLNNLDDNNICFSDNFGIGIRNSKLAYMFGEELVITDVDASVDAIYEVQLSKNGLFVNNLQVVERFSTSIDFVSDKTLLLGAGYDNDDIEILNSKNIYYCKVYDVDEFEYPVMEDGNMIMSVLNQVNLVDDTFESFGGTDTEIKDTLDEVMNKPKTKSNIPDLVRNYTCVRTNSDIEEDSVYGFWNYADKKFYTATEGKYKGEDDIEYVELEYIQSTGTQYIDTLVNPVTNKTYIEIKITSTLPASGGVFGVSIDNGNTYFGSIHSSTHSFEFYMYNWDYQSYMVADNSNTHPNQIIKYNSSGRYITDFNGNVYASKTNNIGTFSIAKNMTIFGWNSSTTWSGKIYYCKLWNDQTLIRDLVPVKRKSDNVLGMYDKVNDVFYTNAGTGNFIAGPELYEPYIELEYIESTGTQYINTNYKPNNNTIIDTKLYITQKAPSSNYDKLFGATDDSSNLFLQLDLPDTQYFVSSYYKNDSTGRVKSINQYSYNTLYQIKQEKNKFYINDVLQGISSYTSTYTVANNLYIFNCSNSSGTTERPAYMKLYYFKIYNSNTLVRDLIPVKRKSDNVICMYDLVSKQFYTNSGTGTFIAGPEV